MRKARDAALPRLRDAGFVVRNLEGRDADEALDLARQCVADGVESLVVVGGDGMVHLAVQAVAKSKTSLGIIPAGTGNDVARYFDLPRKDPIAAADRVIGSTPRKIDLARSGTKYFVTVLAAGFDAIVNERANRMTWPKGQIALQPRHPRRAARLRAAALHHRARRRVPAAGRDAGRRRQRPVLRRRTAGSPRAPCSTTVCWTSWSSSR